MKLFKGIDDGGFTLVELLIVIALIAILSVAVLATINPIEQANKARDSKVQNDAAEVMNAYERYYAGKSSYPWVDVVADVAVQVDTAFYSRSSQVGFALCSLADPTTITESHQNCDAADSPGLIVTTQELKNSFLNKGYTTLQSTPSYSFQNELYLIKEAASEGNSIYVCYVPKANANRENSLGSNSKLKALTFTGASEGEALPTTFEDATAEQIAAAEYTTLLGQGGNDTLFRCVPE